MRNDLNKVVPKLQTKVSISHAIETIPLDSHKKYFSEVEVYYSDKKPNSYCGVLLYHSLSSMLERLHTSKRTAKDKNAAFLKGLYEGGTAGQYCKQGSPFLFFDIDVKENENKHLFDAKANADVFEQLNQISVLVWRSNSQRGIAGILYVPKLTSLLNINRSEHKRIGDAITEYLQKELGVNATFDTAQSKFRQIRYLANQQEPRKLNPFPYRFDVEVKKVEVVSKTGIPQYKFKNGRAAYGSIQHQFNERNKIHTALLDCNFRRINDTRYLHPATTSKTTGEVIEGKNIFISNSTSFDPLYSVFSPYWLYYKCGNYGSVQEFNEYLNQEGYSDVKPTTNVLITAKNALNVNGENRKQEIFKACYDLQNLAYNEKRDFAKENARDSKELSIFFDYLKIKPLTISYDKTVTISKYVSEQLPEILDYSDKNSKTIIKAGTGLGKTTAVLRDFKALRSNKRLLFLAPLTVIVEQIATQYDNIITLTGQSLPQAHTHAKTSTIVVGTYEQGLKHLRDSNNFDYVVIDEVHNLISGYNYKAETLKELTFYLRGQKLIGLTGTPSILFKSIGYKLLNIDKVKSESVEVTMRIDNRDSAKIVLQHLSNVNGKALIRLNDVDNLKEIKNELLRLRNYSKDEVLILHSSKGCKISDDFKRLSNHGSFRNEIKIVLTTGLIDEGLSIEQMGFTDMVFIENQYNPNPEPVKQFFARFRNTDVNRKNYYYFKQKKIEYNSPYNPYYDFNARLGDLRALKRDKVSTGINEDSASNDALFYDHSIIDRYALAKEISETYFKQLTTEEYILFHSLNYDINLNIDERYNKQTTDINLINEAKKKKKLTIISGWKALFEDVENAIYKLTEGKDIKKEIEYNGEPVDDDIMDLVNTNLKLFEFLYRAYLRLQVLEIQDVDEVLFPEGKFSKQKINRSVKFLQNLKIINNPQNKREEKNSDKLKAFVREVVKLEQFKTGDLFKIWKKMRVTSMNVSSYDLVDLVLHFKPYYKCSKTKRYIALKK